MKHSVKHDLPIDLAKKAAAKALESYKERFSEYDPQLRWNGDANADVSFAVKGAKLTGNFAVLPDRVDIEMDVPLLLRPFKGKAMDVVENEINKWMQKAKNGELG